MRFTSFSIILLTLTISLFSCSKDNELRPPSCERLTNAISHDDAAQIIAAIEDYVNNLPSQAYTKTNLENLVAAINGSGNCSVTASLLCFDCIYTLPAQSEITVSLPLNGQKTIDLTPDHLQKIKVLNVHD